MTYDASSIEVLKGLEPVRKRPGMYTQTERPNHLVLEVVDNAVDEAIAGHAGEIEVTLHADGAVTVADDGRGMPVDQHAEGIPAVEVILTRLHAGAKFSQKDYRFSGGLHGVGVSVVNALSEHLEVRVKRDGKEYRMSFAGGETVSELEVVGSVGQRNTGTTIRFRPDAQYFDSVKISVPRLHHALRAKAVLCPGLVVHFHDEETPDNDRTWQYEDGLSAYLLDELGETELLPAAPITGKYEEADREVEWALVWLPEEDGLVVAESYVNLIPTPQGGTHVNGLRSGTTDALREFCDFHDLLPRGLKISPDDVWSRCSYILSTRVKEPQFSGQTKERLANRDVALFVAGAVKDAVSLWLNQHTRDGEAIAGLAIANAQARARRAKKVKRKKVTSGPALPGKLADCSNQDREASELFLVEGDSAGGSAKQARDREFQAIMPLRGKILNTWEVDPAQVLGSQEVHDIAVALGVDPGSADTSKLRYGKVCILADADSDGAHIATLLCALFVRHFPTLVREGRVYVAMPPLFRVDVGKDVYYALDEGEKERILEHIAESGKKGKVNVQRFKGLGEMNPLQLRETTMAPDTRRLVRLVMEDGAGGDGGSEGRSADRPKGVSGTEQVLDMLLAKKRSADRREWLEAKGNEAEVL